MLHHQPQIQFISQSQNKYQLINIDNCPEVLDKISQMDKIQLAKLLEAIAYRFKEING
ncbi:hypothetical protein [Anabaena sp. AL93]|jgi:hypothetical protein|uniref:hypothetical protein n=1 Tax=Anabaena sp. AL93 TaxID=1678133 RepID=UPI000A7D79AE|nr:hypothetical protein [Anabaena sp. AL93]